MDTPVALVIFNRPEYLEHVFERVAQAKPRQLFVIADGPRPDRPDDVERCAAARTITERIDWDCQVYRNYAETNMGCGRRPSSGISWVFEHVDRAIIIEDDCVPDPSFFRFCEEMLERYADDPRVMQVSGRSVFSDPPERDFSYYFSRQLNCWGWATWARAWKLYDYKMSLWPQFRDPRWLRGVVDDPRAVRFFMDTFEHHYTHNDTVTGWDQQWNFCCFVNNGLGVRPYRNLVEYIGFEDATHKFFWGKNNFAKLAPRQIDFPLRHPPGLVVDKGADELHNQRMFGALARQQMVKRLKMPLSRSKAFVRAALAVLGSGLGI